MADDFDWDKYVAKCRESLEVEIELLFRPHSGRTEGDYRGVPTSAAEWAMVYVACRLEATFRKEEREFAAADLLDEEIRRLKAENETLKAL